jgi:tRNA (cytidine/uridine-2'-O-)-methyltransferase
MIIRPKIALYEPDIPQNTAAIIRTCSCLDVMVEIIEPCGFMLNDKRFKRVVMDYLDERMIKFYKNYDIFFKTKKKEKERIVLMTTKASTSYSNFKFNVTDTILFGRESAGVPEKIHKLVDKRLKIPLSFKKRSLNLASSVAITLAESLRQNKLI